MEKQEMEKKFKGYNTQLLQNKFKKSTSEVEKEVIASILQKRGVMPIAEVLKGYAYDEEQEKPFEVEDKNEEPQNISEKIKKIKEISRNEGKRTSYHKADIYGISKIIPEIKVGKILKVISKSKEFIGRVENIYVAFGKKDEVICIKNEEGKIKRVFSRIIKEKGYELQTK